MMDAKQIGQYADKIKVSVKKAFIGRDEVITLATVSLFAGGHILLEDVPGTGKTLLARSLSKAVGCEFRRIQFTPDLLPSDISGINFFNQKTGEFSFRKGPVFANIVLADEINRATPRTQSALLECMQEKQVTVDGDTKKLDEPFFVIATQNPIETQGTFPLPEAQLDRFIMKIDVGYISSDDAFDMLQKYRTGAPEAEITPVISGEELCGIVSACRDIRVDDDIMRYIVKICEATRENADVVLGASQRAALALMRASQAYAAISGRAFVIPDDVKYMAMKVLPHRLVLRVLSRTRRNEAADIVEAIVGAVDVPTENDGKKDSK